MNRCRTCKYYVYFGDLNEGCCEHKLMQDVDNAGEATPRNGVKSVGEHSEYGFLFVGPDFGCIHHKAKKKRKA